MVTATPDSPIDALRQHTRAALDELQTLASDIAAGVSVDESRLRSTLADAGRSPDDLERLVALERRRQRAHSMLRQAREIPAERNRLIDAIDKNTLALQQAQADLAELLGEGAHVVVHAGQGRLGVLQQRDADGRRALRDLDAHRAELMNEVDRELAALEGKCCNSGWPLPEQCQRHVKGPSGRAWATSQLHGRMPGSPPLAPARLVGPRGWSVEIDEWEWRA